MAAFLIALFPGAGDCLGLGSVPEPLYPATCTAPRSYFSKLCAEPGFGVAVSPFVRDLWFPRPQEEASWRNEMRLFVPCIVRALDSPRPCDRLFAAYLLGEIRDPRAVLPLIRILESGSDDAGLLFSVRQVLAEKLKAPQVVPHLLAGLRTTDRYRRLAEIFLARDGPRDPRLLDLLIHLYEEEPPGGNQAHFLLEAIRAQTAGNVEDARVREIMWRTLEDSKLRPSGFQLASAIARPSDFPRLAEFFMRVASEGSGDGLSIYLNPLGLLRQLGGERFPSFLKDALSRSLAPVWKRACADALMDFFFPENDQDRWSSADVLSALEKNAQEAIPYAQAQKILGVLMKSTGAWPSAPSVSRAGYWRRAARLFEGRNDVLYEIEYRIAEACGPDGTGEMEDALEALRLGMRLDPIQPAREFRRSQLADLERRLARRRFVSALAIVDLVPVGRATNATSWRGRLLTPSGRAEEFARAVPICMMDYLDHEGLVATLPARWRLEESRQATQDGITFTVSQQPLEGTSVQGAAGMRLRLLYVATPDEDFQGTVASEWIPLARWNGPLAYPGLD